MKEFLSEKGLIYNEQDVTRDEAARNEMVRKTGRISVPTVTIGEEVVVGFDKSKLEKLTH